jgi:hypothetical protein
MKNLLIPIIALIITSSLLYAYQLKFKRRWPGKHGMDIHALWGTSILGRTGSFNDEATLLLSHPIDRIRVWHDNGYQLKVYDPPNLRNNFNRSFINEDMNFEVQDDGELRRQH